MYSSHANLPRGAHGTVAAAAVRDRAKNTWSLLGSRDAFVFAFSTWVAVSAGYYAAFALELDGAVSTGICIIILAQPVRGKIFSKALNRMLGTVLGAAGGIVITALFAQDRTMLLAAFTLWIAAMTGIASLLRDYRAYGFVLAGYTAAIISVTNIDHPNLVFIAAVNRAAAIAVGVLAITAAGLVFSRQKSADAVPRELASERAALVGIISTILQGRGHEPAGIASFLGRLASLRGTIEFAALETSDGRSNANAARYALSSLYDALAAVIELAYLRACGQAGSEALQASVGEALSWERPDLGWEVLKATAAKSAGREIEEVFVVDALARILGGLTSASQKVPSAPGGTARLRAPALRVHHDIKGAGLNALRVLISMSVLAVLCVWSGISETSTTLVFTAVFFALAAVLPRPETMGRAALVAIPMIALTGVAYEFFILPAISGYPLFMVALAPMIFLIAYLIKAEQSQLALIYGSMTLTILVPANVQGFDPSAFVTTTTMLLLSCIAIYASSILVFPVSRAKNAWRFARSIASRPRKTARRVRNDNVLELYRDFDRLTQFVSWHQDTACERVRHTLLDHLIAVGSLRTAIARARHGVRWALDLVGAEMTEQAFQALRSGDPEKLRVGAHAYLEQARVHVGDRRPELLSIAASLHATAHLLAREARFLRRFRAEVGTR